MTSSLERVQSVPRLPLWVLPVVALGIVGLFALSLPVGFDRTPDIVLEGLYLGMAVLILVPVRRFDSAVIDLGWQLFVMGRFIDFLDEIFVEPEPFVEPYLSGMCMVLSLAVIVVGFYALVAQRDQQITDLQDKTEELTLRNNVLADKTDELALKNRVIDEAPIGITIADMTQEDEPLIDANDAFTSITGYDASETIGRNCRYLQGEETDPEPVSQMRRAIAADQSVQVTLRNYRKDGTLFWNEITLAPLPTRDGEVTHYAGFQQDATERKRYEQALKSQRDNLDLLNEMLRHDIRNKLQLVMGRVELLRDTDIPEGPDHVETIENAAREAVDLTHTAQKLSEIMLDSEPALQPVSLSAVLRDEIDDTALEFAEASIHVEGDIPQAMVTADEMLSSVFRNLLRNAVQHNQNAHPQVTVSTARTDGTVTVAIADDGPGIPDELKERIFARGEKGLESEGTGIGTYLVDTLVERYGGEVRIEDNEPTGASFTVELPLHDPDS